MFEFGLPDLDRLNQLILGQPDHPMPLFQPVRSTINPHGEWSSAVYALNG
jgi:hypothetical protein